MSANIIDGKAVAAKIREEIRREVAELNTRGVRPGLATVLVGEDPASQIYVRNKHKACEEAGLASFNILLPKNSTEEAVLSKISELNKDPKVHAILVQLPLPAQIRSDKVLLSIRPDKDADGFHPQNLGKLFAAKDMKDLSSQEDFIPLPCTPRGCIELIASTGISLAGKNAVVVGRSTIVGKPMAALLLAHHATVTITHSRTRDLAGECRRADVLVAAIGKSRMIKADLVSLAPS
jgi:methylenetetrahydrofolate dehydrogenase (NADP+)/methenyltetrahydrofolate cyclohydrolase